MSFLRFLPLEILSRPWYYIWKHFLNSIRIFTKCILPILVEVDAIYSRYSDGQDRPMFWSHGTCDIVRGWPSFNKWISPLINNKQDANYQKIIFAIQRFKIGRCVLKGSWVVILDWLLPEDLPKKFVSTELGMKGECQPQKQGRSSPGRRVRHQGQKWGMG